MRNFNSSKLQIWIDSLYKLFAYWMWILWNWRRQWQLKSNQITNWRIFFFILWSKNIYNLKLQFWNNFQVYKISIEQFAIACKCHPKYGSQPTTFIFLICYWWYLWLLLCSIFWIRFRGSSYIFQVCVCHIKYDIFWHSHLNYSTYFHNFESSISYRKKETYKKS